MTMWEEALGRDSACGGSTLKEDAQPPPETIRGRGRCK